MKGRERWRRRAVWFLALSYGVAAPVEVRSQTLSEKFGYPPLFIHAVCVLQVVCAFGVLARRTVRWACVGLTVVTLGEVVSHLRVESPLTAVPAVVYTAIQTWLAVVSVPRGD